METDDLVHFEGMHGTARGYAEQIKTSGFRISADPGRLGKGVYLWAAGEFAKELAISWHAFRKKKFRSKGIDDSCCVLRVTGEVEDVCFLNLLTPEARRMYEVASKKATCAKKPLHVAVMKVIQELEKRAHTEIKVLYGEVPAPSRCFESEGYDKRILGLPKCYVIFCLDTISDITEVEL